MKKLFEEIPFIPGERIVLDRVVQTDADALQELVSNPRVYRYLPTFLFEKQRDDVHETIRLLYGDLFLQRESIILAIRERATGQMCGLAEFYGFREELNKISMGYRLLERHWGRGLASEAASSMVGYLYSETVIELITASTMIENLASARVLEKSGFIRTAHAVEEDWGYDHPTITDKWFC